MADVGGAAAAPVEADLEIRAGVVATMDARRLLIRDGVVAVKDDRIVAVGARDEVEVRARRTIDAPTSLMTPGLIDSHNHPVDYLARGLVDSGTQRERIVGRVYPFESALSDDEAYVGALGNFAEMLSRGTTCFADGSSYQAGAVAAAAADMGIRAFVARKCVDVSNPVFPGDFETTADALRGCDEVFDRWDGAADGRVRIWNDLGMWDGVTDELAREVAARVSDRGTGILGHIFVRRTRDAPPQEEIAAGLARYQELGVLRTRPLFTHVGWVIAPEIELFAREGVSVAHCPSSSLMGGNGLVRHGAIPELLAAGVAVGLGSDASAISRFMDMVRVMWVATCAHREIRGGTDAMDPYTAFEMATVNGARALHADDEIGSIEVGKKADLAVFSTDDWEWAPQGLRNPIADLVLGASGAHARTVIVDGRVLLDEGRLVNLPDDLRGRLAAAADSDLQRAGLAIDVKWPVA
jgi:5-methylthioadenosine/S-adenosylhomocysteine deaminase